MELSTLIVIPNLITEKKKKGINFPKKLSMKKKDSSSEDLADDSMLLRNAPCSPLLMIITIVSFLRCPSIVCSSVRMI